MTNELLSCTRVDCKPVMATLRTRETGNCGSVYGKEKEILYFPKQQNGGKAH